MEDNRTWDCVKKPVEAIVTLDPAPKDNFCSASGSSRRPPTSPSNVVAKKSTHFHPFCSKSNFVWGGRGGVASFSNFTGKVSTLLTSGETIFHKFNKLLPRLCYQCLNNFTHLCKRDSFFGSFQSSKPCSSCNLLLRPRYGRYGSHLGNLQKNRKQSQPLIRGQYKIHFCIYVFLRACLHRGGVPQVGGVTACPYNLPYGHPTYHENVLKLKGEIIWIGGLPYLSGLPHLLRVPHLHVTGPYDDFI